MDVTLKEDKGWAVEVLFSVRDTGIGIAPSVQQRLFQPFEQADSSTVRKYGGTGLGLAICKRLVEMMEGQIGCFSAPGQGATFYFSAPLAKPAIQPVRPAGRLDPGILKGARVLIVDDNATNRLVLRHQLTALEAAEGGVAASDGMEALAKLRDATHSGSPFAIALLDMQMPGMDGLMLARAIKSDLALRETKLVMLTSLCDRLGTAELREAGIETTLAKPVKQKHLFQALRKILDPDGALAAARLPAKVESKPPIRPLKLLVAEDNVVNQRVALKLLARLGYSADVVANGVEALKAVETIRYDAILMDCHMPEMDGYEAARQIRARGGPCAEVRIIALTASAMQSDKDKCLEAGMDDYVPKPTRLEDLEAALRRVGNGN